MARLSNGRMQDTNGGVRAHRPAAATKEIYERELWRPEPSWIRDRLLLTEIHGRDVVAIAIRSDVKTITAANHTAESR